MTVANVHQDAMESIIQRWNPL